MVRPESINLALTFAKELHQTVLLVDCYLRRQSIHRYLGFPGDKGLKAYFENGTPLKDLIVWPGTEKLTLISGGQTVRGGAELQGSPKMEALVKEMKNRYKDRYVFFDVPPVLSGADTLAFAPFVDCIVMVVQAGKTSIKDIKRALEMISKEKFLGFVLNRQQSHMDGYYQYV